MSEKINKNFKGLYDTSKTTFITDRTEPTHFYEPEAKTPRIKNVSYSINFDKKELYKAIKDLQQKVKQLEKENEYLKMSNPEQNMEHFRIVNENKRKIDMLRKENHQLEKENIKQKEIIENLTTMAVCGDKKQIKNTAQYKLEQLENIRKEVIEELSYMSTDAYVEDYDIREKHYNLLMNILSKGDNNE